MKKLGYIVIFIFSLNGFSQVDSLECNKGIQKAIEDSENGIYNSFIYGLPMYSDWDFRGFYENYIFNTYGIKRTTGGCVLTEYNQCYSKKMDKIIFETFGDTIFSKAYSEAERLYPISIQTKIDTGFVFYTVDTYPEFIGGRDSLSNFINKNIRIQNDTIGTIYCSFIVSKTGSLSEFKIARGLGEELDREVIRLLKTMPNWSPGILNGQKVRTKVLIPIKFN